MSIFGKFKDFGKNAEIITRRYRGPDRRDSDGEDPADDEADLDTESTWPRRRINDRRDGDPDAST